MSEDDQTPQDKFQNIQNLIGNAIDNESDNSKITPSQDDSTSSGEDSQDDEPAEDNEIPEGTSMSDLLHSAEAIKSSEIQAESQLNGASEVNENDVSEAVSSSSASVSSVDSDESKSAKPSSSASSVSSKAESANSGSSMSRTSSTSSVGASSASSASSGKTSSKANTASEAKLQAHLARIYKAKSDDFMASHEIDGKYDPPVVYLMGDMINSLRDYIKTATYYYENKKRPNKKTFKKQMKRLQKIPSDMSEAMVGVWSEFNRSFLILKRQIDDLNDEHHVERQFNPLKETHLLIRWVKKGVPTQMEKDFYRLDKIANDPRFEDFLNENHVSKKIPVPEAVVKRRQALHLENKRNEASKAPKTKNKKGGRQNNGDK